MVVKTVDGLFVYCYHDKMIASKTKDAKSKQIIIRVSQDLHREIKILSAETGTSINDYVVSYLEQLIKQNGSKK